MTLNSKNLTNIALMTAVIGLAAWMSVHLLAKPATHRVSVVEISDLP